LSVIDTLLEYHILPQMTCKILVSLTSRPSLPQSHCACARLN